MIISENNNYLYLLSPDSKNTYIKLLMKEEKHKIKDKKTKKIRYLPNNSIVKEYFEADKKFNEICERYPKRIGGVRSKILLGINNFIFSSSKSNSEEILHYCSGNLKSFLKTHKEYRFQYDFRVKDITKDNSFLLYSNFYRKSKLNVIPIIHELNITKNEKKMIGKGYAPTYSPNERYILFSTMTGWVKIYDRDKRRTYKITKGDRAFWIE